MKLEITQDKRGNDQWGEEGRKERQREIRHNRGKLMTLYGGRQKNKKLEKNLKEN